MKDNNNPPNCYVYLFIERTIEKQMKDDKQGTNVSLLVAPYNVKYFSTEKANRYLRIMKVKSSIEPFYDINWNAKWG